MDHSDHVGLIRGALDGAGPRWLELGAGEGAFTLALADLLGPGASILATDRNGRALAQLERRVEHDFPETQISTRSFDFTDGIPYGPFDGVLAANALHFVPESDRDPTLRSIRHSLALNGRLVIVEYDADRGNAWVPFPFSFARWRREAITAGFEDPRLVGRVPSRFLRAMYAAVTVAALDRASAR